jgi:hypothetical protein
MMHLPTQDILTYINLVGNVVYGIGEFVGGLDIMTEMYESGELVQALRITPPQLSYRAFSIKKAPIWRFFSLAVQANSDVIIRRHV